MLAVMPGRISGKPVFFLVGSRKEQNITDLFAKLEGNQLYGLIENMGLSAMASCIGLNAGEIVRYRKCDLCEKLFNSDENLDKLKDALQTGLPDWTRWSSGCLFLTK